MPLSEDGADYLIDFNDYMRRGEYKVAAGLAELIYQGIKGPERIMLLPEGSPFYINPGENEFDFRNSHGMTDILKEATVA